MTTTKIVGKNPLFEEFKSRGWKYKEGGLTEKQFEQYRDRWGWRKYGLVGGELVEDERGTWAKDPNKKKVVEPDEEEVTLDFTLGTHKQHCKSGGSVFEQDGRFFSANGVEIKGFNRSNW